MVHLSRLLSLLLAVGPCHALSKLEERQAPPPSTTSTVFVAPTAVAAPDINSSYYDISQHFCRIYRHASVYADGKIYIDGGNTYVPRNNGSFNDTPTGEFIKGMNNNLIVLDLSTNFTNQDTFPYHAIHKSPDVPSSLIEHTLWYSAATRKIYQLGGWFSFNNVNDPGYKNETKIPESSIWEFDLDAQTWSVASDFAHVDTGNKIDRPGAAANCDAPALNMSFIFEGYVQQRSDQDYINFTKSADFKFLEGMLYLDTSTRVKTPTLTNISVPLQMGVKDFGPRMNGAMVHVPIGKYGVVVQIGGQMTMSSTQYGVRIPNANQGNTNIPLSFVDIYDIESGYWFRQDTFGLADGIPSGRSDICTVMIPANDSSSFNIYMVAGVETYQTYLTTEEIWVLTLPTFQWTLVHSRSDGMYGHTCHAVGENLLMIGGMKTQSTGGDVATCSEHMPAEIFSLVTGNYTGIFDAAGAKRLAPVPTKVFKAIGGDGAGGAYIKAPKAWSDLYLQYIFDPTLSRPAYTPLYVLANTTNTNDTTPADDTGTPKSVIIGAAVGGTVGGLLVVALLVILFLIYRKKKATAAAEESNRQSTMTRHSELPAYTSEVNGPAELMSYGHYPDSIVPNSEPYSAPSEVGNSPRFGNGELYAASEINSSVAGAQSVLGHGSGSPPPEGNSRGGSPEIGVKSIKRTAKG
ncbi:hypothetical protein B0T22DRAFT_527103, partial [Podospora appendiculata]